VAEALLVLGWHNGEATPFFPSAPGRARDGLVRQLRAVRRLASVVPLESALRALVDGRPLPPRATALTFDDGYRDNLDYVLPALRHLGLPATFYLVPGVIERSARPWWETLAWAFRTARRPAVERAGRRLPAGDRPGSREAMLTLAEDLKRMSAERRDAAIDELIDELRPRGSEDEVRELFLDWDGARRLAGEGAIGSHTLRHAILSEEAPPDQERDLRESRRALEDGLGVPVGTLAYPNGTARDYDSATLAAARAAGYEGAVTTIAGWNRPATPRLELRRFVLDPVRGLGGLRGVVRAKGALGFAGGR
jgi:peptidoglycan/xylan/chitin deacetylase (PgdA/CDA1 family)